MSLDENQILKIKEIVRLMIKEEIRKDVDENSTDIKTLTTLVNDLLTENKIRDYYWSLLFKIIGFAGVGGGVLFGMLKAGGKI